MRKIKLLSLLMLVFGSIQLTGQNMIRTIVQEAYAQGEPIAYDVFEQRVDRSVQVPVEITDYTLFELKKENIASMRTGDASFVKLTVPVSSDKNVDLDLYRVESYAADYAILQPSGEKVKVDPGVHYRGVVHGSSKAIAAFSFYEDDVMGIIFNYEDGNIVLGEMENGSAYISYNDKSIQDKFELGCGTPDDGVGYTAEELAPTPTAGRALSDCVRLFIEVDYDVYQNKGGTQGATNYATGFMNQVSALYSNENINTSLTPMIVWSQASPYTASTTSALLGQFQNTRTTWTGDLAGLVSYKASGGIAAGFNGLCNSNRANSMCYNSIASTYNNVPTYSWTVDLVTHEFGHIFGSRHTHACVWNGNNTAIDGCAGFTEGSCSQPGNPSGGGTIMSYCHNASVGKNLSLGFGPQPGNVIRNRVTNASCLSACNGDGGGGGDTCSDNEVVITIVTDNYASETSWTLKNASGSTIASGSGYNNNSTNTITQCLPNGCYDFTINDSYGDGICCSYGNGSYTIKQGSTTLASGGSFSSSETKNFCVGGSGGDTQAPTAPTNLSASGTTTTTTVLSWTASSDNVGVTGYDVFNGNTNIGSTTSTSVTVNSLTPATAYTFRVRAKDAAGNTSGFSNSVTVTTLSEGNPPANYCTASGNNAAYEWIDYVKLNNMTNSSGSDGGYKDNTNMTANLPYGSNTIQFSAGFSSSSYSEYWKIFIDYNKDGDFTDAGELIVSGTSSNANIYQATFTVPTSATAGSTRMRVMMKYGTSSNASCGTFTYGEVEDYTVVIGGSMEADNQELVSGQDLEARGIEEYTIYPNPVSTGELTISKTTAVDVQYALIDILGKKVLKGVLTERENRIDISSIQTGMYIVEIFDGQKTSTQKVVVK